MITSNFLYGLIAVTICVIGYWAFKKNYHHNRKDEFTYIDYINDRKVENESKNY